MIIEPLGYSDDAAYERNKVRGSLRTGGWTTDRRQDEWVDTINTPESSIWYWRFGQFGMGGLVNIDRWNRSAEIAILIYETERGKGHGKEVVNWLLEEAFDRFNLHKVWAEVYDCNENADAWPHLLTAWAYTSVRRPAQKYWNGHYYHSTTYDIINPNE